MMLLTGGSLVVPPAGCRGFEDTPPGFELALVSDIKLPERSDLASETLIRRSAWNPGEGGVPWAVYLRDALSARARWHSADTVLIVPPGRAVEYLEEGLFNVLIDSSSAE